MTEKEKKEKKIVFPGELLVKGMDNIPGFGTYRKDENIFCSRLGLLNNEGKIVKVIPLSGAYTPKQNDVVIGKIFDIIMAGWRIDINSPYSAMLSMKEASYDYIAKGADLSKLYDLEEYVVAKIVNVTSQKLVDLSMKSPGLKKLIGGRIIKINTHKVPRLIGRKGSMVSMIKDTTGCKIIVGQNGLVWIQGTPEMEIIAINTVKKIEKESYLNGLTEKIKSFLETSTGKKIDLSKIEENSTQKTQGHERPVHNNKR